jgi:hypothetical protein
MPAIVIKRPRELPSWRDPFRQQDPDGWASHVVFVLKVGIGQTWKIAITKMNMS